MNFIQKFKSQTKYPFITPYTPNFYYKQEIQDTIHESNLKKILKHISRTSRKHIMVALPASLETVVHHNLRTKHSQGRLLKRATNTATTEAFSQWILTRCSLHKKKCQWEGPTVRTKHSKHQIKVAINDHTTKKMLACILNIILQCLSNTSRHGCAP